MGVNELRTLPTLELDIPEDTWDAIDTIYKKAEALDKEFGRNHARSILHTRKEMAYLYEIASGRHDIICDSNAFAIQCGTYRGGSACAIARGLESGQTTMPLWAIDNFALVFEHDDSAESIQVDLKRLIDRLSLNNRIASVYHDNISFLKAMDSCHARTRFAFIDSSHEFEPTLEELRLAYKMRCKQATTWIVVHDYAPHDFFKHNVDAIHCFIDDVSAECSVRFVPETRFVIFQFDER